MGKGVGKRDYGLGLTWHDYILELLQIKPVAQAHGLELLYVSGH